MNVLCGVCGDWHESGLCKPSKVVYQFFNITVYVRKYQGKQQLAVFDSKGRKHGDKPLLLIDEDAANR